MSTLPGVASKGEKSKPKFQSLDINSLYRVSRGENPEKQQQKSTFTYKHGMQSLGKVPNARRAPANLPSLKSEHSGSDASVPLVPPGGPGWGKQDSVSTAPSSQTPTPPAVSSQPPATPQLTAHQAAIALPVTTTIIPPPSAIQPLPTSQQSTQKQAPLNSTTAPPAASAAGDNKLWSAITSGQDALHPPIYQSQQFQNEFPSLSVGDGGVVAANGIDSHPYTPGLSLRPQTEGSWHQGGGKPGEQQPHAAPLPAQFRAVMPNFMYKGNYQQAGAPTPSGQAMMGNQLPMQMGQPNMSNGNNRRQNINRQMDADEVTPRPIIKEEELIRMDEYDKDMGWTCQDEIDYNQKLAFSDDESPNDTHQPKIAAPVRTKEAPRQAQQTHPQQANRNEKTDHPTSNDARNWHANNNQQQPRQRSTEDDVWKQRRNQHNKDLELTVLRAKQRKEEEEKRFNESTKQGAAKKLLELEERIIKKSREEEGVGTINPMVVPAKPIIPAEIPLPDFQRDKERERTPSEAEEKPNAFKQLTQIEGKSFRRGPKANTADHERDREMREQNGPSYSRHYQNPLPPRFQKQRHGAGQQQHFQPWKRQEEEPEAGHEQEYRGRAEHDAKWTKDAKEDWHGAKGEKFERPQRPDSRDSRTSRDSRHSEHVGPWADCSFDGEEKARNSRSEPWEEKPRRGNAGIAVPGPITKDRIEADDYKNEKRNLTQLKRGLLAEKKLDAKKDEKMIREENADTEMKTKSVWADATNDDNKFFDVFEKKLDHEAGKKGEKSDNEAGGEEKRRGAPSRGYVPAKSWGGNEYHRSSSGWSLNSSSSSTSKGRSQAGRLRGSRDFHTDSEGSLEEQPKKEAKPPAYMPRGEPSRLGRGGNFRSGRGGISKRIDGYGPPPSKSPFGGHEDGKNKGIEEASEDRAKQNQQALTAGISARKEERNKSRGGKVETGRPRVKKNDEVLDSNSDNSDDKSSRNKSKLAHSSSGRAPIVNRSQRPNPVTRSTIEKKAPIVQRPSSIQRVELGSKEDKTPTSDSLKVDETLANKVDDLVLDEVQSRDLDGFQEVKSKKAIKKDDKVQTPTTKPTTSSSTKPEPITTSSTSLNAKLVKPKANLTQQQISNIPPLMGTPINPPPVLPSQVTTTSSNNNGKKLFERPRVKNLAPRFEKQRENNRLQKVQQMQQQINVTTANSGGGDVTVGSTASNQNELNKQVNQQNLYVYAGSIKDGSAPGTNPSISPIGNTWDKGGLVGAQLRGLESDVGVFVDSCKGLEPNASQSNSPSGTDKIIGKSPTQMQDKALLDGTTPPMATIIFENTNYKSVVPGAATNRPSIGGGINAGVVGGGSGDLKPRSKLDEDELNIKIQSVKKMWDHTPSSVGPTNVLGPTPTDDPPPFVSTFDPAALDPNAFAKSAGGDPTDDGRVHDAYSPSPNQVASNATPNVCKVKPTQQVGGPGLTPSGHLIGQGLMGHPLSPPPLPQAPPPYAGGHLGYQPAAIGGGSQYGIPAIPSPPTVMYNSTQQLQPTAGLYGAFQLDQGGVQAAARSQYSQYYGLGQSASSPYSQQSIYFQTQQHPPPSAPPMPDLYQNLSNYRMSGGAPFGQNQQLNNPTTVLISSTSNSLMSASVKPSGQQISAIGTKAGGVGQAYQQQSQQSQQVYMTYEPPPQGNYLQNAAMQRGPSAPVQNNVVQGLQPSSSYYSAGSTGQAGYYQQQGNSTLQSAQMQQHQAGYGLQGNVFGTHNQSHTNAGLQSFNSHFLSNPIHVAAAINAQQYRTQYLKGQQMNDQSNRSQQMKSPSQDALCSVFNSGSQISSPKLRQNCNKPPPQPSPTAQHKYNLYQNVGNQQSGNMQQRYPGPIQRPVNFQQNMGVVQNNSNSSNNQNKHRTNNSNNKVPPRPYYQCNSISNHQQQNEREKIDDAKQNKSNSSSVITSVGNKTVIGASATANSVNSSSELAKDSIKTMEESSILKD